MMHQRTMESKFMENKTTEREINLLDLFWVICLKWRQIIAGAMIVALIASGYSYYKNMQERMVAEELEQGTPEEIEEKIEELELEEISLQKIESHAKYQKLYEDQVKYSEQSPLMQLEHNGFYKATIAYYVDNYYEVEYPLINKTNNMSAIMTAYNTKLTTESFQRKVKVAIDPKGEMGIYASELVDPHNRYGTAPAATSGNVMFFSAYGKDEETCLKLSELIIKAIAQSQNEIATKVGEHSLDLLVNSCNYIANYQLQIYQRDQINLLESYRKLMDDMRAKFTEEEARYFDIRYGKAQEEALGPEQAPGEEEPVELISIQIVAMGLIGGVAIVAFWIAIFYTFNAKLRLEDDFERIYGLELLGTVKSEVLRKKRFLGFIDEFIIRLRDKNKHHFTQEEAVARIAAAMKIYAKKLQVNKIYATGSHMGANEKNVIEKLTEALKGSDIELIMGQPILYDVEALERSAEVGCVILLEKAGESLYQEVSDEIGNCVHHEVRILGAIVVA